MDTHQHPESVPTKEQIKRAIREAEEKLTIQRQFDRLAQQFEPQCYITAFLGSGK